MGKINKSSAYRKTGSWFTIEICSHVSMRCGVPLLPSFPDTKRSWAPLSMEPHKLQQCWGLPELGPTFHNSRRLLEVPKARHSVVWAHSKGANRCRIALLATGLTELASYSKHTLHLVFITIVPLTDRHRTLKLSRNKTSTLPASVDSSILGRTLPVSTKCNQNQWSLHDLKLTSGASAVNWHLLGYTTHSSGRPHRRLLAHSDNSGVWVSAVSYFHICDTLLDERINCLSVCLETCL
jgi:hypothetical protein